MGFISVYGIQNKLLTTNQGLKYVKGPTHPVPLKADYCFCETRGLNVYLFLVTLDPWAYD